MQDAHTLHMDPSNLVFVQMKFKLFTSKCFCIHSFPLSKLVLVQKWDVKLKPKK